MSQLEELCKELKQIADMLDVDCFVPEALRVQTAAEILERCYEILNFEGPDGRYRDELNQLAAKAMNQEPR